MATATRIYIVSPRQHDLAAGPVPRRLVRAVHPANALRHVADGVYSVTVASQEDLVAAITAGARVEDVKPEQRELPGVGDGN